jgi:Putative transposase/Transposase zinc-binding domain
MSRPAFELAQVIRAYKQSFIQKHNPLKQHLSVLHALEQCRTAALGGHVDTCDNCNHLRISYNSCRNRHCPKCQNTGRERWIEAQQVNLLPTTYFHVVFTLPQELNTYCLSHPKEMYNLLFHCSKETITTFAHDCKHLGAQAGMISVLHTWGQNLSLHPHVHLIIPGGGITADGYWKHTKNRGKYLFPVKAMSTVFKHKFMQKFISLLQSLQFCDGGIDAALRKNLYNKEWVVYAKQPFLGPQQVIEYLGRYTHKIAISNHRIKNIQNGKVTFSYKDYTQDSVQKEMTLDAEEFLRRFCLHILPKGFMKIRHYGFLASRARPKLKMQQMQMGIIPQCKKESDWKIIAKEKLNFDVEQCPSCKTGRMVTLLSFDANGPPLQILKKCKESTAE